MAKATKSKRLVAEKRAAARKPVARETQRLTSRERKDQRWCASLSKRQLSRNAKCRKVLDKQEAAKRPPKPSSPALTKADRRDDIRCGKLSLNQVLRDARCRKVAERHLSGKPVAASSKTTTHRAKVKATTKASAKSRSTKKRSRR